MRPVVALLLGALTTSPTPAPPKITRLRVIKSAHTLELYAGDALVERDVVALGPGGAGPKLQEGDRVTPVGHYRIVGRHPSESFHIFLLLDYPNRVDRERFAALKSRGELPREATIGGNVGLHGGSPADWREGRIQDWTAGCLAVDDATIERIAARVKDGTSVDIED